MGNRNSSFPGLNQIDKDVSAFVDAVKKYGGGNVDGLTIGNEVADTPQHIMQKVWDVRKHLHDTVGYKGPVSTVHTWVNVMQNPILCNADRVTVNAHAFYDGKVQAGGAGGFINNVVVPNIRRVCAPFPSVKNIIITESGWPSRGGKFGAAVPSLPNEQAALRSLNCAAKTTKITVFEADDSTWKNANENEKSRSLQINRALLPGETNSRLGFGVLNKGLDSSPSACFGLGYDHSNFQEQDT